MGFKCLKNLLMIFRTPYSILPKCNKKIGKRIGKTFIFMIFLAISPNVLNQPSEKLQDNKLPNIIIILVDDLGYGDLSCYGSTSNHTYHIDQLAEEGMLFTDFYVTAPIGTPSRASFLTGSYPKRVDMHFDEQMRPVLFPVSMKGLNPEEVTIADLLKTRGYETACIGKWGLGDQPNFLPNQQGFDLFYGVPYSNDMVMSRDKKNYFPPFALLENNKIFEISLDTVDLTWLYTQKAIEFMESNQQKPFFLFLSHTLMHSPLRVKEEFKNKTGNGLYGDGLMEVDWSTGEIIKNLERLKLEKNSLIIFLSDNGAEEGSGGKNSPLRGFKNEIWEGGTRVPCIMKWPGQIPVGSRCKEITSTMDILPTLAHLTKAELPSITLDGHNIFPIITGQEEMSPYPYFAYYLKDQLQAIRWGKWKMHVPNKQKYASIWKDDTTFNFNGALYNLENDLTETTNVWNDHPTVVKKMLEIAEEVRSEFGDQGMCSPYIRPAGYIDYPKPLVE